MTVHFAGDGFSFAPGDIVDRPKDEAVRLVARGYAVPFTGGRSEKAVKPSPAETRDHHKVAI